MIDREGIVREFFGLLWRFFHARVDRDVEDLIQQTLAEYLDAAGSGGPIVHPKAYVLRVARSVLFAHYRQRGPFDPLTQTLPDAARGLSSRLAAAQREEHLHAAVEQLPYCLYEVVDLYYGEGLRGPVLAEALGIPEGTVRSRLRRATSQLRQACAPAG